MECFDISATIRQKAYFGFDWQFILTDKLEKPDVSALWRDVQLPHDWSADYRIDETALSCGSGGYVKTGIGWYRRVFEVKLAPCRRASLLFDGVYMKSDVWVNGHYVGGHVYGYTSFELDITDALQSGENEILVRVDNSRQPGSRWYSGSGITRDVWLLSANEACVANWGVFVRASAITEAQAMLNIEIRTLRAREPEPLTLTAEILKNGIRRAQSAPVPIISGQTANLSVALPQPELWDVERPCLYEARVRLFRNETLLDEASVPFGVRSLAFDAENGFLLNGRKLLMRGVCLHHDGGCVGAAVPREVWERRLKKLKAMGCNALRCSHNPPDPALLELADQIGFVVMDEAFDEWQLLKSKEFGSNTHESRGYSEWFDACWREDLTSMLLRDRNHPSVVMWSIGNEIPEQGCSDGYLVARRLAGLCHALDDTRPITAACDQVKAEPISAHSEFLDELDVVGVNYTDRWRERTETFFDEEHREHPSWKLVGTEDVSVGGARGEYDLANTGGVWGRHSYYSRMLKAEKLWKYVSTRPFVIGDFMWTGIDYLGECFWPQKNASSGVLDTCGFEKDGYYFYQSLWIKDQPVLHVFPNLNQHYPRGTIVPFIVYTNCFSAELFVNGVSRGVKAYEFPAQGMTREWGHFERRHAPVTTNDLHLTWELPYDPDAEIIVIGRDMDGNESARRVIRRAGSARALRVTADRETIFNNGRSAVQLEIALLDAEGAVAIDDEREIRLNVEGGTLLGMDNGDAADHSLYRSGSRTTFRGLAYAIIRKDRSPSPLIITVTADGLPDRTVRLPVTGKDAAEETRV